MISPAHRFGFYDVLVLDVSHLGMFFVRINARVADV